MKLPLLFLLCAFLAQSASAQVRASLVSATQGLVPGQTASIALRLEHEDHWHTYWRNPGTGLPTKIVWRLPAGYQVSEILWPGPTLTKDSTGGISGHGYEGDTYLPLQLKVPQDARPGEQVTLEAEVRWLMCRESCQPGSAKLTLSLPITTAAEPTESGDAISRALARVPAKLPDLDVRVYQDGGHLLLRVAGKTDSPLPVQRLHFFSHEEDVDYEKPQQARVLESGLIELRLPLSQGARPSTLSGVLGTRDGQFIEKSPGGILIDAPVEAGPAPALAKSAGVAQGGLLGLGGTLGLAFIGGLILNLMPCVFPVLGIKILGFVQQAGSERRKVVLHGLVFTLGVLLSFWALALVLLLLRSGGSQLGWGFQLQSPAFVLSMAVVMLVFGLNMSGLFEFGLSATAVGAELQMKQGYSGSFFTGVLATLVATPCSAPFLAPALGAALALPPLQSMLIFTAIAVGLSLPYLLLSLFPGLVRLLPRPGAWMDTFKQAMAFLLYATVAFLLWVLASQLEEQGYLYALLGLVIIALALWDYGRHVQPHASKHRLRGGLRVLLLAGAGLWLAWPAPSGSAPVTWEAWSPERLEQLRREGRSVYVDFTARWCFTCQTNKKAVFGSASFRDYLKEHKVALLKADWTNQDPAITAELARWGRSAVPFNLVYLPGKSEPVLLPEILTATTVLEAFEGGSTAQQGGN